MVFIVWPVCAPAPFVTSCILLPAQPLSSSPPPADREQGGTESHRDGAPFTAENFLGLVVEVWFQSSIAALLLLCGAPRKRRGRRRSGGALSISSAHFVPTLGVRASSQQEVGKHYITFYTWLGQIVGFCRLVIILFAKLGRRTCAEEFGFPIRTNLNSLLSYSYSYMAVLLRRRLALRSILLWCASNEL